MIQTMNEIVKAHNRVLIAIGMNVESKVGEGCLHEAVSQGTKFKITLPDKIN